MRLLATLTVAVAAGCGPKESPAPSAERHNRGGLTAAVALHTDRANNAEFRRLFRDRDHPQLVTGIVPVDVAPDPDGRLRRVSCATARNGAAAFVVLMPAAEAGNVTTGEPFSVYLMLAMRTDRETLPTLATPEADRLLGTPGP